MECSNNMQEAPEKLDREKPQPERIEQKERAEEKSQ